MLSWKDEADTFSKRSPMTKAGSLQRPGNSLDVQRVGSSRRSTEVPASPGSRQSVDMTASPASSLPKANSLIRGPGNAAEGTLGAEGWWHHMDNSQMNEPPVDDDAKKGQAKAAAFVLQFGITGQSRSLWADEAPATAAPTPAAPPSGSSEPAPAAAQPASTAILAPTLEPIPAAAAANGSGGGATIQNAAATGWWAHMDNGILNQPAETAPLAPGAVRKGERVMGGGYMPQMNLTGGSRYGSILDEQPQQSAQEASLEQQVAGWGPFLGQDGLAAPAEEGWSAFNSAPKVA